MSLKCRPHAMPSGVPCIHPPTPPGPEKLRLPVMTVNGTRPDASGNVAVDLSDIGELSGRIAAETSRAQAAERALDAKIADAVPDDYGEVKGRVAAIEAKVPAQASEQNQLADKAFVNSSIATNTANYISNNGEPFQSLSALLAYSGTVTNNDYAFVVGQDANGNTTYTRYKYCANATPPSWSEEYVLNNSSFTAAQWATINTDLGGFATKSYVDDAIGDLAYKPIEIKSLSVSPSSAEVGSTISSVTLSWTLSKAADSATLDNSAVTLSGTSGTIPLTGLSLQSDNTWTLEATDAGSSGNPPHTDRATARLSFMRKRHWGAAAEPQSIDSAFLLALSGELASSRGKTFTVNAGAEQYIWYAVPASFGECSFKVGGFDGGFTLVSTFSHTNASGATADYRVYRSDNANLGSTSVTVS